MSDPVDISPQPTTADGWLRYGQALESHGKHASALTAYDQAIALFAATPARDVEIRRQHGIAWMNRGNALKNLLEAATPEPTRRTNLGLAVAAYDQALELFQTLPLDVPLHRNHLGAACVNRGHASLLADDSSAAIAAFEQAIAHLADLPLDEHPAFRLNLAGAWTNLAHTELAISPARALTDARTALGLVAPVALVQLAFAEMSLRARRVLGMALGKLLVAAESARQPVTAIAAEASDVIDEGLAVAREWEARGTSQLRPLAVRLFRLGAHLYRVHQPHFLGEFLLENLDPAAPGHGFAGDAEFRVVADEALQLALSDLQRPQVLLAGTPRSERVVATAVALRAAQQRLAELSSA